MVEGFRSAAFEVRVFFAGGVFGSQTIFEFFDLASPKAELDAEVATAAVNAVGGRFAGGLFGVALLMRTQWEHRVFRFRVLR